MAENKIHEEVMTDSELDGVAGGTVSEIAQDVAFLAQFGIDVSTKTIDGLPQRVAEGWKKLDLGLEGPKVICEADEKHKNVYYLQQNGKTYTSRYDLLVEVVRRKNRKDIDLSLFV